jgi:hypothetical protein
MKFIGQIVTEKRMCAKEKQVVFGSPTGISSGGLVVGLSGTRGFVAIPR